jgi:hypothetical protein
MGMRAFNNEIRAGSPRIATDSEAHNLINREKRPPGRPFGPVDLRLPGAVRLGGSCCAACFFVAATRPGN